LEHETKANLKLCNEDEGKCYYDGIPLSGTEEWFDHMREEERKQARHMRLLGQEAWEQRLKQGTISKFKFQHKRARESQPFSTPLFSEAKNHNDGMLSRSETEPINKLELNNARLPAWTVTSPNNVFMTNEGNPGAGVDQFSDSLFGHQDRFGRRPQFWRIR
jgi:hypothetical protein